MKKLLSLLLMLASSLGLWANGQLINGIYYILDDSGEAYVTYTGNVIGRPSDYSGNIVIPSTVSKNGETYTVTAINDRAFYQGTNISSISLPNTLTRIGIAAFEGCLFYSINLPNSITTIDNDAFRGCESLVCNIPTNIVKIGTRAFDGCSSLSSLSIPASATNIGNTAFQGCSGLTAISVAAGNPKYDSRNNCNAIIDKTTNELIAGCKNTVVPNTVTKISTGAFRYNTGITSLYIPNSVTCIENYAFNGCENLVSITLPDHLDRLGMGLFSSCHNLTAVTLPSGITAIKDYTFYGCRSLTSIIIPEGVDSIGDYAFQSCSAMASATLPESLKHIGEYAFRGCSSLTEIVIPEGVSTIKELAFSQCSRLTSVTLPSALTTIEESTFEECSALSEIVIPEGVSTIGNKAFYQCKRRFEATVMADVPPTLGNDVFPENTSLIVACGHMSIYWVAPGWDAFAPFIDEIRGFVLTLTANNEAYGYCAQNDLTYCPGSSARFAALPNEGYEFVEWSDGVTANPRTMIINDNAELQAIFREIVNAVEELPTSASAEKILRDGQLIILRNGKEFTATGIRL